MFIWIQSWFHLLIHHLLLPQLLTPGNKCLLCHQVRGKLLPKSYVHNLVILTGKLVMLEWNGGHWNINRIVHFCHLHNFVIFSKINDSVKYSLQKWIIYHSHLIKYPIVNDYIAVKFDDGNGGVKTELRHKLLLRVSVCELHIDMQKICYWVFHGIWWKRTCTY